MIQVTFAEVQSVLESLGSSMAAAESHGYMCGALCTSGHYTLERWLAEVAPAQDVPLEKPNEEPLQLLMADTIRALRGDAMEFEPFLPEDDATLAKRTAALSEWCHGFLFGYSLGGIEPAQWPHNVGEILRDITDISRVDADAGEGGEEDEQSYAEVLEYVRVGVQLIHDELHAFRQASPARH